MAIQDFDDLFRDLFQNLKIKKKEYCIKENLIRISKRKRTSKESELNK